MSISTETPFSISPENAAMKSAAEPIWSTLKRRSLGHPFLYPIMHPLETLIAVIADIKDKDGKLDNTVSAAISIGGGWAGSMLGAKAGAMLGVLGGPAAPLTIPVLSLVGGIAGSIGDSRLAKYVVDITYAEE